MTKITQNEFNALVIDATSKAFDLIDGSKQTAAGNIALEIVLAWKETTSFEKEAAALENQWSLCAFNRKGLPSLDLAFIAIKESLQGERATAWKNGFYNAVLRAFFRETGLQDQHMGELDTRGFAKKADSSVASIIAAGKDTHKQAAKTKGKGASLDSLPASAPLSNSSRETALLKSALAILDAPRNVKGSMITNASIIEAAINAYQNIDAGAKNELITAFRGMAASLPTMLRQA